MITQTELKGLLDYNPETGVFTWRISPKPGKSPGCTAGSKRGKRGVRIVIQQHEYLAHRLAWFYTYNVWPDNFIDHINQDPLDNRLCNLRLASNTENQWNRGTPSNNTSGHKGVRLDKQTGKWKAQCTVHGKAFHLGYFKDVDAAIEARRKFATANYGEFYHG